MKLTYDEAVDTVLETTEIGYTLKSQDKLWVIFAFDLDRKSEMKYSRFYPSNNPRYQWSYDMDDDSLMWTSRQEAETAAAVARFENPDLEIFVINWGDDSRFENYILGIASKLKTKFKGSKDAVDAMIKYYKMLQEERL